MNGGETSEKEGLEKGRQKILTPKKTIHVLSLGAGVQSSMLALMAARGLERVPLDTIDFDALKPDWVQDNLLGMGQECEGICGV